MRLQNLCENQQQYNIYVTRDSGDFKKIKQLDAAINGGKGYMPPKDYITIIAKDGDKIVGFAVAKPYREVAYKRRSAVDHNHQDVMQDIVRKLVDTCKSLGFKYSTARANQDDQDITEVYGDHVSSIKYPTKTVNIHRLDHSAIGPRAKKQPEALGRPTQKVPGSRDTSIYKS